MIQKADTGIVRKKTRAFYAEGTTWVKLGRTWHDQRRVRRACLGQRMTVEESGRADLSEDLG